MCIIMDDVAVCMPLVVITGRLATATCCRGAAMCHRPVMKLTLVTRDANILCLWGVGSWTAPRLLLSWWLLLAVHSP